MRLRVLIHRARLGGDEYRVVRPAHPPTRAVLLDHDRWLSGYVNTEAAQVLATLWQLAAHSRHSLIHLPMRTNPSPVEGRPLDLVLLHHSLGFPPSRWKSLRARLGQGLPHTVRLRPPASDISYARRHYRENRDRFDEHVHAETVFLVGSPPLFRETAHLFRELALKGPSSPDGPDHACARLHSNDGTLGNARELHVEHRRAWPT
ncbi:hypothetical protein [Saccharothrix sp.]|uniref:hypothetical protein n=1 Tax=Saccharothrix sp. TaxID=1873460 RepID=UPI0028127C9E|nr:hypothetical protein [Saccharothrix sp.]